MKEKKRYLFRIIVPAVADNVFNRQMKATIALGPIIVATVANKLFWWDVEIIHEAGSRKKILRDDQGNIDHKVLQQENPADIVGIYCGISQAMSRAFKLMKFYKNVGSFVIAGGKHVHYEPLESLRNGTDIITHGDSEKSVKQILINFQKEKSFSKIPGISFIHNGKIKTTAVAENCKGFDCQLENLPYPNFSLIRDCKIKIYPIGRIRGCSKVCEFCTVREKARWSSAEKFFRTVQWLVETAKAKRFFLVDDRIEEDKEGLIRFFRLIKEKYGKSLEFTIQIRLEAAKDRSLLALLHSAGVRRVCIGYESPIDEELKAMKKGYLSKNMLEWTQIYHSYGFFIHAMFMFGYPGVKNPLLAKDRFKRFKRFIQQSKVDSIQVFKPVPLVGSPLRERLKKEKRLLPLSVVPWKEYGGLNACFIPEDMTVEELQKYPTKIMGWFYHGGSFWRIGIRTLLMPFDYLLRDWNSWYRGWRNDVVRYGGSRIYKKWMALNNEKSFIRRIENFLSSH